MSVPALDGHRKSLPVVWRDAIRDSELDRAAKLVAHTLSTYMDGRGQCWPSQAVLARGCSATDSTVRKATHVLELAGFLAVAWSKGRGPHHYRATLPQTANELRRSEWLVAGDNPEIRSGFNAERRSGFGAPNPEIHVANPEIPSDESVESVESEELADEPQARARDGISNELAALFGSVPESSGRRKTNATAKRSKAVADLKAFDATPEQIRAAFRAWSKVFGDATCTDVALATHFGQLRAAAPSARRLESRPPEPPPELSDAERQANVRRMRQLGAAIGKDVA